jgi:hypothetical protein
MIAHVAEAVEARGRVVLRLTPGAGGGQHTLAAVDAAVRLARAYRAEIESLYIEDVELLRLASFSFAAEMPALGHRGRSGWRPLCVAGLERDMRLQVAGLHRLIGQRAAEADVPVRLRILRDDGLSALASTCADCGPWNVVVLSEPLAALAGEDLARLFAGVPDATGLLVIGHVHGQPPKIAQQPVVLALEDAAALPAMLHTAERLVDGTDTPVLVVLVGGDAAADDGPDMGQRLESQVRLVLSGRPTVMRADGTPAVVQLVALTETHGEVAAIAEALRRLAPGFLIARFGGVTVPPDGSLRVLGTTLCCPLLLIR